MVSITPCQRTVSDRFPVVSFVVNAPPQRLFEIACATDATLFRADQRHRRTANNFFSTRLRGLMRAPAGQTTFLVPPEQLRRFAGARRLFYNAGSYASPRGEDAMFSVAPDATQAIPSIQISPDFTGKTLDRSRLGGLNARAEARYGAAETKPADLVWGGDLEAPAPASAPAAASSQGAGTAGALGGTEPGTSYDDGYPADLWKQPRPRGRALGGEAAGDSQASAGAAESATSPVDEPPGFEDAPDLNAHAGLTASAVPALEAAGYSEEPATRYGNRTTEPSGFEDGAAINRSRVATRSGVAARGGRAPVSPGGSSGRLGAQPPAEPPGFEDAPALAAARKQRLGAVAYAEDDAPSAAAPPVPAPLPATTGAQPAGRDNDYDDGADPIEEPEPPADLPGSEVHAPAAPVPLTIPEKFKVVALVARGEGGTGRDAYATFNADGEYSDPSHAFYHRRHVGLSWGLVQFTQLSGALGRVLRACQRRDPQEFARVFGADSEELLRVTNADEESDRLEPVGPSFLWEADWPERFRRAGQVPAFQAAQNEVAIEGYFDPNLPFARGLGWDTDRALAILFDRSVHMGNAGAQSWIIQAAGPIRSQRQRVAALSTLGFSSLQAFAESVPELGGDGRWTALAHATLVGALRALGTESPVPVPPLAEQLDRVVAASAGHRFADRVQRLRTSTDLFDVTYLLIG